MVLNKDKKVSLVKKDDFKILFFNSDCDNSSGAFLSMVTLIEILRDKYGVTSIVAVPDYDDGVEILISKNIPFYVVGYYFWTIPTWLLSKNQLVHKLKTFVKKIINKKSCYKLSKIAKENNINLIHINTTHAYIGAEVANKLKIPFVWHLREFFEQQQDNVLWEGKNSYKLINKANKIIAVSDHLKNNYKGILDDNKLIRIYNGIDIHKFYNPDKEIFNKPMLNFIIVGRLIPTKGQLDLAKACAKLYSEGFSNFQLTLIGKDYGNIKNKLKNIFDSVNMDNIIFIESTTDIRSFYNKSDILFMCTNFEAFGRVTVEAMLSGLLVIGSDTGGTLELLEDNRGLLYETGNVNDLYEKIKFAINNPEICRNMAISGRKYMYENMSAEKNADNIFKVYLELLNNK